MKKIYMKYLILVVVFLIFLKIINIPNSIEVIKNANPFILLSSVLLYVFVQLIRADRFRYILSFFGTKVNIWQNITVHFITPIIARISPGKIGEASKVLMLKGDKKKIIFVHILERVSDFIALALLSLFIITSSKEYEYLYIIFIVFFAIGLVILWHSDKIVNIFANAITKKASLPKQWFKKMFKKISFKIITFCAFGTLIYWFFQAVTFYVLALSIGLDMNFLYFTSIFCSSIILGVISGIPGGFGSRELGLVLLLTQFGIASNLAQAYSLLMVVFVILTELMFSVVGYLFYRNIKIH